MAGVYSVTQINTYIKNMFKQDFVLNKVSIKGEISNCKYHTSGHIYFTLKDESGTIAAVMFAGQTKSMDFLLAQGQKVIVNGKIDVYERDGKYQLYANEIVLDGAGDLYKKFEELKKNLEEMGMFSREYKRQIPAFSRRIGIVTASTGAAIQDIINIARRRNPYAQLILFPAVVQGESAKDSIVNGIETLDTMDLDVIIVGRGGGSIEDLWAFNEEIVARAIFNCNTPLISAVGHETDFTIADFVADLRAPTPSAAAELAVADISLVEERIYSYYTSLNRTVERIIYNKKNLLDRYKLKLNYLNPISQINDKRQRTMDFEDKLTNAIKNKLNYKMHELALFAERLNGLSPLSKLNQGYAYAENLQGNAIKSIQNVTVGEHLKIHVSDGFLEAEVVAKEGIKRSL